MLQRNILLVVVIAIFAFSISRRAISKRSRTAKGELEMLRLLFIQSLIVVVAFASSGTLLWQEVRQYRNRGPQAADNTDWKAVRAVVPKGDTLGFVTDESNPDMFDWALYFANYRLAPLIVENTLDRRVLLSDFRDSANLGIAIRENRLRVVQDLGNGVVVLERR